MKDIDMLCSGRNGIMTIKSLDSSFYGGNLNASGYLDLSREDTPYQIDADIKALRLSDFKKDTAFKDNDISGIINARFGLKGNSADLSKLNGWGRVNIFNGNLWQINLFRGIGTLIFKRDFGNVVFKEGACSFSVKDRAVFTNDLIMKSDLLNLYGAVRLSFDNSIGASLKCEFTDEGIDAGNFSDIAGAIEKYSIIEVRGTLKEPQYKIRPDMVNIVSDLADNFFRQ